jgi:hypothetical protein
MVRNSPKKGQYLVSLQNSDVVFVYSGQARVQHNQLLGHFSPENTFITSGNILANKTKNMSEKIFYGTKMFFFSSRS